MLVINNGLRGPQRRLDRRFLDLCKVSWMLALLAGCASKNAMTKPEDSRSVQDASIDSQADSLRRAAGSPEKGWDSDVWPPSAGQLEEAVRESLYAYTQSELQDSEVRRIAPTSHPWVRLFHDSSALVWFEANEPFASDNRSGEQVCATIAGDWVVRSIDGVEYPQTESDSEAALRGHYFDFIANDTAIAFDQRPCIDDQPQGYIQNPWNQCYWYALGCAGDVRVPFISWGMRNRGVPPALPTTSSFSRVTPAARAWRTC